MEGITSQSSEEHFETFSEERVEDEQRLTLLTNSISEGVNSGIVTGFNVQKNLEKLKTARKADDRLANK